jgi:hypothetical protein
MVADTHRRTGRWRAVACTLVLLLLSASSAYAQFDRGSISGTVKDPQSAVVPGVTVTVTSPATEQSRTTVTDGGGFYTFPNLPPGRVHHHGRAWRGHSRGCRSTRRNDADQRLRSTTPVGGLRSLWVLALIACYLPARRSS